MQMAYAWYPEPHRLELRYVASPAGAAPFAVWRCDANEPVPSLAAIAPLLSWYEREITDLFGLAFTDHPQPHRLVLHDGVRSSMPPFAPDYPPDRRSESNATSRSIPEVAGAGADVQLLPFGPVRADVVEFGRVSVLLRRRSDPALSSAAVLQASRHGEAVRGPRARAGGGAGRAGLGRRQRGARARLLPGGRSRGRIAPSRPRASSCACCWRRWSASTTICIISAISATPRRSRSARRKASCSKSEPSNSTPG